MGYEHRVVKAACPKCNARVIWSWQGQKKNPSRWRCQACDLWNILGKIPEWPELPRTLYIGHQKNHQVKIHPVPPGVTYSWAQPYSIRSIVSQASSRLGGCNYWCQERGTVMGEPVFHDMCGEPVEGGMESCDLLAGFTLGRDTCALWKKVSDLCQTPMERNFLRWYLELVKDRQFPMLIPQVRIGIAERRRPDFVVFVPRQYWSYKLFAVQLDGAHPESTADQDKLRDAEIALHGYEVVSLRPERQGYLEEVKRLVEQIERQMLAADADPWAVALDVPVARTEEPDDTVPF